MGLTLLLILGPTITMMVFLLLKNPFVANWAKLSFGSINFMSLMICLKFLFRCAFSDPGIIPANAGQNKQDNIS